MVFCFNICSINEGMSSNQYISIIENFIRYMNNKIGVSHCLPTVTFITIFNTL